MCHRVDSAVPTDHTVELKESEEIDKNLYLARELKKKGLQNEIDGNTNVIGIVKKRL